MIIDFKYGLEYKGFLYGWKDKELYRLPSKSGLRYFGLKKLSAITVGNQIGYRLKKDKFSIFQLKDKTILINKKISVIKDDDLPF